jgi:hypothetical protein
MVIARMVSSTGPLDDAFVIHVIDDVLLPVLGRDRRSGP